MMNANSLITGSSARDNQVLLEAMGVNAVSKSESRQVFFNMSGSSIVFWPASQALQTNSMPAIVETRSASSLEALSNPQQKEESLDIISTLKENFSLKKLFKSLFDTQTLFGVGDWAKACLSAQQIGTSAFAVAGFIAVKGRLEEVFLGRKPGGDGFYAMGWISAATVLSIGINSLTKFGEQWLNVSQAGPRHLLFDMGAFGAWTAANFLGGYNRKNQLSSGSSVLSNHQTWFCIGSILVTYAEPVSLALFTAGLVQALRSNRAKGDVKSIWQLLDKHLTPSRFRALAYTFTTISMLAKGSMEAIPYALWMLGNFAFDNEGANSSIKKDIKALKSAKK